MGFVDFLSFGLGVAFAFLLLVDSSVIEGSILLFFDFAAAVDEAWVLEKKESIVLAGAIISYRGKAVKCSEDLIVDLEGNPLSLLATKVEEF